MGFITFLKQLWYGKPKPVPEIKRLTPLEELEELLLTTLALGDIAYHRHPTLQLFSTFSHSDIRSLYQETLHIFSKLRRNQSVRLFDFNKHDRSVQVLDYFTLDHDKGIYFNPNKTVAVSVEMLYDLLDMIGDDATIRRQYEFKLRPLLNEWIRVLKIVNELQE